MYVIAKCEDMRCPARTMCKRARSRTEEENYGILVNFCREEDAVNCNLFLPTEEKNPITVEA